MAVILKIDFIFMRQPRIPKIKATSPDKVYGKLVKYQQGDCLSIDCKNGKYLGVIVSEKFNAYYDFTLIEFYKEDKPQLIDFIQGKFFGTRFGSWEELTHAVDKQMMKCKFIDNCSEIEKTGNIKLNPSIIIAGYAYLDTIQQLNDYYLNELPVRIEKSKNAEKFPDLAFVSKHLVEVSNIIK